MFLINKDGSSVIKVNQVDMRLEYDERTKQKAREIRENIMVKCYNYGSTANAENAASERVRSFLYDKKPLCRIFVNDKWYYGDYDEVKGKIVFEEIVSALKNESAYFDMRYIEFKENEENANKRPQYNTGFL